MRVGKRALTPKTGLTLLSSPLLHVQCTTQSFLCEEGPPPLFQTHLVFIFGFNLLAFDSPALFDL